MVSLCWSRWAITMTGAPFGKVSWAKRRVDRFTKDWTRYMRGDIRIKRDVDVTEDDFARHHVIVFGDPGSNAVLAKLLPRLPVTWTRESLVLGKQSYAPENHIPVLIAPNPLNPKRYVVVNSGHTFGAREFEGTNALLFPRLGDFAVICLTGPSGETVLISGDF